MCWGERAFWPPLEPSSSRSATFFIPFPPLIYISFDSLLTLVLLELHLTLSALPASCVHAVNHLNRICWVRPSKIVNEGFRRAGMRTYTPPNPRRGQTSANLSAIAALMGEGFFTETAARGGICHWFAVIIQIWLPAEENHSLQDGLWGSNKSDTIAMQSIIWSAGSQETGLCSASAAAPHITLHFALA